MDGTETNQDTIQAESPVESSGNETGTPEVYTREQVDKLISDRLAQAGREAKALETMKADIAKRENEIRELETKRQRDEEERELAELTSVTKDKPEELPTLKSYKDKLAQKHRALMEKEDTLRKKEAEFNERFTKTEQTEFEINTLNIANKHGVDHEILKTKAIELGIKGDKLEDLAKLIPKRVESKPDSGKTVGGSSKKSIYEQYINGEITKTEFTKATQ